MTIALLLWMDRRDADGLARHARRSFGLVRHIDDELEAEDLVPRLGGRFVVLVDASNDRGPFRPVPRALLGGAIVTYGRWGRAVPEAALGTTRVPTPITVGELVSIAANVAQAVVPEIEQEPNSIS